MKGTIKIGKSTLFIPVLLVGIYSLLYFFLKDYFLFTPDYTSTDIVHYTVSYKYYVWQSLRAGFIPWWTQLIGGGFPLLAESPVGMLFIPYYIIFPLFSNFTHAFAFLFCFHLFVMTFGMYLFLVEYKISRILSFLLSLTFVWNGAITFRWVHFTVLQAFSFTPLLFWLYKQFDKTGNMKYAIWFLFLLNQMIMVGYIQAVFITLLGLCCHYLIDTPHTVKKTLIGIWALVGGVVLSLPQLIPTLQLSTFTSRPLSNTYDFAVSVPFNLNNLCSFFIADCLGSAKAGTYNTDWQLRGVFWENTPYLGLFFMILIILGSVYVLFFQKKNNTSLKYLLLFALFVLLALGKNSPLYFLFSIFPFTMFRTPGRYLVLATFFLITYSSFVLERISKKNEYVQFLVYLILILNVFHLAWTAFTYHVFVDSSTLYKSIDSKLSLPQKTFYITYGAQEEWNSLFASKGWQSMGEVLEYLDINRASAPNSNLITGSSQFDMYASMPLRRNQFVNNLILSELEIGSTSAHIETLLELYGISTIVSYKPLHLPRFSQIQSITQGKRVLKTYQNTRIVENGDSIYFPEKAQRVSTIEEVEKLIADNTMSQKYALVETFPYSRLVNTSVPRVKSSIQKDMYMKSIMSASNDAFVVYRISWYPEWELTIDGKKSSLYRTNLLHMGFLLPKGSHIVELRYVPKSFYIGCIIAALFIGVSLVIFLKVIKRSK